LSYAYWQSAFGGSMDVIGKALVIAPSRYTIIGVAPRAFAGVERETPTAFVPVTTAAIDEYGPAWAEEKVSYGSNWLSIYVRRRASGSAEEATTDLSRVLRDSYRGMMSEAPAFVPPIDAARPTMMLTSILAERGPRPSADARVATWLFGVTSIVLLI